MLAKNMLAKTKTRRVLNATLSATLCSVLGATALITALISTLTPSPASAAKAAAKSKKLSWTACATDETLQCATLAVPVDRAFPTGEKINLSLQKRPVGKGVKKLGTLLTGSGFPGNSGNESMAQDVKSPQFNKAWLRYDVIGYEHRGTGKSTPITCATKAQDLGFGPFVSDDKFEEVYAAWVKDCTNRNLALTAHMSASDSAGDIEALRLAIGESQLSFQLWNHDATVGATYNALYPGRVKNMALVDPYPLTSSIRYVLDQAQSDEARLSRFVENCAAAPACPLNAAPGPFARIDALLAKVKAKPIPLSADPADGKIDQREVMSLVVSLLPDESDWTALASQLVDLEKGEVKNIDASDLNFSTSRYFLSELGGPFWSIACQDGLFARSDAEWDSFFATLVAESPHTRWAYLGGTTRCINWPIATTPGVNVARTTKTPVLVISRAERLGLPTQWSPAAAATLGGRVFTTAGTWDECITQPLTDYFNRNVLPASEATCG
jgi:pimeloyl-ACP methyl ester carboxylesterase